MVNLPFNLEILRQIAVYRQTHNIDFITAIMKSFTFFGDTLGYILVISLIYWVISKEKAYQITIVFILSTLLNFTLKVLISNPRPFVLEGTTDKYWAISKSGAEGFSTPSGHAQGSMAFWFYTYSKFKGKKLMLFAITMITFIGLSRPYLGVHYFEDIILGWLIAYLYIQVVLWYERSNRKLKFAMSTNQVYLTALLVPFILAISVAISYNYDENGQTITTLLALISGLLMGIKFENLHINFESRASSLVNGILRFILGIGIIIAVLYGLKFGFMIIAEDATFTGILLRFVRYWTVAFSAGAVVPWVFTKVGLAQVE